jgi:hypothetical protein
MKHFYQVRTNEMLVVTQINVASSTSDSTPLRGAISEMDGPDASNKLRDVITVDASL